MCKCCSTGKGASRRKHYEFLHAHGTEGAGHDHEHDHEHHHHEVENPKALLSPVAGEEEEGHRK